MMTSLETSVAIASIKKEFLAMSLLSSLMAMKRHAKMSSLRVALAFALFCLNASKKGFLPTWPSILENQMARKCHE